MSGRRILFATEREYRLARLSWRAHRRFMRRSNRSIAMFTDERLSALASEAAQLSSRLRFAAGHANRDSNRA